MVVKSTAVRREEASIVRKKAVLKAVPSRTKTAPKSASMVDASLWGVPPEGATLFGILRKNDDGVGERKRFEAAGTGVDVDAWPLDELTVPIIRSRWGGGTYTAIWLGAENGVRRSLGRSRKVVLRDDATRLPKEDAPAEVASVPAQVAVQAVPVPVGVGPQETMSMFMSMWSALQDTNRHAMTLERESYESRLRLQQDFYKEVTMLKTGGKVGGGELEKKVDAIIKRLDEDEDDDEAPAQNGAQPLTVGLVLAQHIPKIVESLPGWLDLARELLKNRSKGVAA
jgi:hypothetical protein